MTERSVIAWERGIGQEMAGRGDYKGAQGTFGGMDMFIILVVAMVLYEWMHTSNFLNCAP